MSTCISREGEYSDHTPDKDYYCTRCYVLDEPALLDRVRELEGGRGSEWARNAEKRARDSARSWVKASKRIDKLVAERDAALSTIAKVEALHRPVEIEPSDTICGECSFRLPNGTYFGKVEEWPCPTLAALDGAPEPEETELPETGLEVRDSDGDLITSGEHRRVLHQGGYVCDTCVNILGINVRWDRADRMEGHPLPIEGESE